MKTYYRCEWEQSHMGVVVTTAQAESEEQPRGWFPTREQAAEDCAARMRRLADDLLRQAESVTRQRHW